MNNEECANETSLECEKEILDVLYKEVVMDMFNKAVKDNNITEIHATGMDMKDPKVMLKVAVCIGAHSKNGDFAKERKLNIKRELIKEINSCHQCTFLDTVDGFADHTYQCPHFGNSKKTDGSNEQDYEVDLQLKEWFERCPKWKEV